MVTAEIDKIATNYDDSVAEIERIIAEMQEDGEKKVEEMLQNIENAVTLYHHCKERLYASEQRLEALFADENDM